MELSGTTEYFPVGQVLADTNSWIRKDTNVAGTVYFGYAVNLGANPAAAVWRIRREVTTTNVTVVTYAEGGTYNNVWDNRAALNYK